MVIDVYSPQIVEKCVAGLPEKETLLGAMRSIKSKDSETVQCLNLEAFRLPLSPVPHRCGVEWETHQPMFPGQFCHFLWLYGFTHIPFPL